MTADELERFLSDAVTTGAPAPVRDKVLAAVQAQLQRDHQCARRRRWLCVAGLLMGVALNLWCGAYDRQLVRKLTGGARVSRAVLQCKEDVRQAAPSSSTSWVQPYLHRFER